MSDTEASDTRELQCILHKLPEFGRSLEADKDHLLARTNAGGMLLIHVPPGDYPSEVHKMNEYLICVSGNLVLTDGNGLETTARVGDMIEVPAGLPHRFAATSDAVVLTYAQKSEGT